MKKNIIPRSCWFLASEIREIHMILTYWARKIYLNERIRIPGNRFFLLFDILCSNKVRDWRKCRIYPLRKNHVPFEEHALTYR